MKTPTKSERLAVLDYLIHRNKARLARDLKKTKTAAMFRAVDIASWLLNKELNHGE